MLICLLESLLIEWTQIEGVLLICFAAAFKWGINRTSVPSVKNQWGVSHHATCLEARQAWAFITLGVTLGVNEWHLGISSFAKFKRKIWKQVH